ncbi:MAG TPA: hydrogen peroxide-inducible genes activator [Candidatus Alistipes merdipullorum]|nr:hydrogen peroxide-inducible genes activator [Candidatus Alistipes merdipullorum]
MTIIQLQYLIEVANCGSFSGASERCFVTQPSLSMQIKALEDELGVVLLDRSKKPVIPTDAGNVVIAQAQETLRAYNYIRESVAELKGETSGKLRLGVIPTIAPYLLHKFIPDFVKEFPRVELEIREMITADIIEALKHDNIDAAIVASGTCGDGIVEHDLFSDRFYAYVSPENPLFERTNIRIEDIDLKDLILLSRGNCMRDQIIELCQARRSVPSHYYFESGSLDTLMRIVDCTACLTIIPEMALEYIPAERRAQVKTLAKGATSRRIAIVVRRTYVKNSIISALESTIMAKAAPKAAAKSPVPATTQPQTA